MKYCQYCGTTLPDEATVCTACQQSTPVFAAQTASAAQSEYQPPVGQTEYQAPVGQPMMPPPPPMQPPYYQPYSYVQPESGALSVCALVFAFVFPLVGLILGIIGYCKHKVETYKKRSLVAMIAAGCMMLVSIIVSVVMMSMLMDMVTEIATEMPYDYYYYY